MQGRRVLLLGLDGFDVVLAERFAGEGLLPNFARLQAQGTSFDIDDGDDGREKYTGLAWEQFASGIRPIDGGRWSSVTFHERTYQATQDSTIVQPLLADLAVKAVAFDVPYFDLSRAPNVCGLTAWGPHEPGAPPASRPSGLDQEMIARFGKYPAADWLYGFCWPSPQKAQAAGEALAQAVEVRSRAARWLLQERLPDWDLGIVVISESHSAIEPLWYGVDQNHPLHGLESAPPAAAALRRVYAAIDRLIGDLHDTFPDATLVLAAMSGMGPNQSDAPAMVLLPELLYRHSFGSAYMRQLEFPGALPDGTPVLAADTHWADVLLQAVPRVKPNLSKRARMKIRRMVAGWESHTVIHYDLDWMPAARYSPFWPKMRAFALPSYHDGRVRLNVAGREKRGIVPTADYVETCNQTRDLVGECRNLLNGNRVASEIHCPKQNPQDVGPSEADVYIVWEGAPLGLIHPRLGRIGPIPYLRTGGHTGKCGFLDVVGSCIPQGHQDLVNSCDVLPTIIELLGQAVPPGISGKSLVPRFGHTVQPAIRSR
jgi:predicted AlkP superfamily phosphohydrolase/phosphomutase